MVNATGWKIWIAIVWLAVLSEGIWFLIAGGFILTELPLSLWLLFALWLVTLLSLVGFMRRPIMLLIAASANLLGCIAIKGVLGGFPHPLWRLLYNHSIDIVI